MPSHALVRRSPTLVIHWQGETPIAQDYAIGVKRTIGAHEFAILARLTAWTRPDDLAARVAGEEPDAVRARLEALVEAQLVEVSSDPAVAGRAAPVSWQGWAPEAALFHFATKDGRRQSLEDATRQLYETLAIEEYPDTLKRQPGKPLITLPPFKSDAAAATAAAAEGSFPHVLRSRRTWRRFGDAPLAHDHLSTLLGLTWGVQQWMRIGPEIRSALKTSPSGGACHSLEAYVAARRVDRPDARDLSLQPGRPCARACARRTAGRSDRHLSRRTALVSRCQRALSDDDGDPARAVEVSLPSRVSQRAARSRPLLPDVLSRRDVAGTRAVLYGARSRLRGRAGPRHRWRGRDRDLRGRRGIAARGGDGVGAAAGRTARAWPGSNRHIEVRR